MSYGHAGDMDAYQAMRARRTAEMRAGTAEITRDGFTPYYNGVPCRLTVSPHDPDYAAVELPTLYRTAVPLSAVEWRPMSGYSAWIESGSDSDECPPGLEDWYSVVHEDAGGIVAYAVDLATAQLIRDALLAAS
jgi:hypothetical protein